MSLSLNIWEFKLLMSFDNKMLGIGHKVGISIFLEKTRLSCFDVKTKLLKVKLWKMNDRVGLVWLDSLS